MSNDNLPPIGKGDEYELGTCARIYDAAHDAKIIAWRVECFELLGFSSTSATALAIRRDIDRAEVELLIKRGARPLQVAALLL